MAVIGITRAAARPPKACEISPARTPAATETIKASGDRQGATAWAASRQICGLTASSTVRAWASSASEGLSTAPAAAAAFAASLG